jgi:hypothetical protein
MYQVKLLSRIDRGSMLGAPNWIKNNSPFFKNNENILGSSDHSAITISDSSTRTSTNSYRSPASFVSDNSTRTSASQSSGHWTPDSASLAAYLRSPRIRNLPREYSQITPGTPGRTSSPKLGGKGTPESIKRHKAKLVAQFKPITVKPLIPPSRADRNKRTNDAWNAIRSRNQSIANLEKNPRYHPNYHLTPPGKRRLNTPDNVRNRKVLGHQVWPNPPANSWARSYDYFGNKYEITNEDVMNRFEHINWAKKIGPPKRPADFKTPPRTPKVTWTEGDELVPEWKTPESETARLLSDIRTPESLDNRGYNNILASPMVTTSQAFRDEVERQVDMMPTRTRYGLYEEDSILTTPQRSTHGTPGTVSSYGSPQPYYGYSPSIDTDYRHYPASIAIHNRTQRPLLARVRELAYRDVTSNLFNAPQRNYDMEE